MMIKKCTLTLIKPAQHVELTLAMQLDLLSEERHFQTFFKEQLKHFPNLGAKHFRVDLLFRNTFQWHCFKNDVSRIKGQVA